MLCWYIFITLSRVWSVGVQWGLNECLTTSNGKRKKEKKPGTKKVGLLFPLFPLSSFLPLLKKEDMFRCWEVIPVLLWGWARGCGVSGLSSRSCERRQLSTCWDRVCCQVGRMVSLVGWESMAPYHDLHLHSSSIYSTYAAQSIHTHTHCEAL